VKRRAFFAAKEKEKKDFVVMLHYIFSLEKDKKLLQKKISFSLYNIKKGFLASQFQTLVLEGPKTRT